MDYYEEVKRRQCKCGGYLIPFAQYSDSEKVKDWSGENWKEVPISFRLCSRCLKLKKIRLGEHPGMWMIAEGAKLNKVYFLCRTYDDKPQYWPQGFSIEGEILIEVQKIPDPEELESIKPIDGRPDIKVKKEWLSVPKLLDFLENRAKKFKINAETHPNPELREEFKKGADELFIVVQEAKRNLGRAAEK